jgi:hypothetical protein
MHFVEALPVSSSSRSIDRLSVTFDDPSLVANAGLLLPLTLALRLGLESLVNDIVRIRARNGAGFRPGRKVLSLIATILAGGSHIDHADILRAGATQTVLPFRLMAPSTLGTFLRSFTLGHIRQLDRILEELLRRSWSLGRRPNDLVVDLDSTICEVFGKKKQGAAYGYTQCLGYHPLLATRADTGEILHARMRKGSSQRGAKRFVAELIAGVRRCGATGTITLRADAGFYSHALIEQLQRRGVSFSITTSINKAIKTAIDAIDEEQWTSIDYTEFGQAEVSETIYVTESGRKDRSRRYRLIVRRTLVMDPATLELFPDWRYHAFVTDLEGDAVSVDQFHRDHARVELCIRDLKEGSGLEHCPSGKFFANAAWLACGVIAHNLIRWTTTLTGIVNDNELTVARTQRVRLLSIPGRIVNRSGRRTLRLPNNWPWADLFLNALSALRALPQTPSG